MAPAVASSNEILIHLKRPHAQQERFLTSPCPRRIIRAGRRSGKAQPLTALVYTPTGPVPMGDLAIGDAVLTPDGGIAHVEAIYPQGIVPIWEVLFGDGVRVECTADHLWRIEERRTDSRWLQRTRLVTTAMLARMPTVFNTGRGTNRRPTLPATGILAFQPQSIPCDPYLLGVLIGDGNLADESIIFSCAEAELRATVSGLLPPGLRLVHTGYGVDYRISKGMGGSITNPLMQAIKSLGLWGCGSHAKFIPACYKYNSAEVRLQVLRGILDTDGWVDQDGQPRLEQTSARLAADVQEVVESLGGLCTLWTKMGAYRAHGIRKETRPVYGQSLLFDDATTLFTLASKYKKTRMRARPVRRFIHGAAPLREAEAQCIRISAPRGLYLTDHCVVTHNTTGLAILAVQAFLAGHRVLYAVPVQEQIQRFWQEVTTALAEPIAAGIFRKNETWHAIDRPGTEQRLRAKTAFNADTLRGDFASVLILDEFSLMNEDAWAVVGAPMMLDRPKSVAIFCYTPPSFRSAGATKAHDPRHAAKLFKAAAADTTGRWATFQFTSHANPYISTQALDEITDDMTTLAYRQEILAEDIDDVPGALWTQTLLERSRVTAMQVPALRRIVVALDPAATSMETSDEMGIVVGGLGTDGHGYTLRDASMRGTPAACVQTALSVYDLVQADALIAEVNNGGEWIETVVNFVAQDMYRKGLRPSAHVNYKQVHASRNKQTRAEPIAAEYEHGRIHHVGHFPALEAEMSGWVPGMPSPSRMDAAVWLYTELLLHAPKKLTLVPLRY